MVLCHFKLASDSSYLLHLKAFNQKTKCTLRIWLLYYMWIMYCPIIIYKEQVPKINIAPQPGTPKV
jgi:hypothetical protein